MAFIFTMHSHRRDMPSAGTLPVIAEDGNGNDFISPEPKSQTLPQQQMARPQAARPPWARTPNASPLSYMSDASGSETDQEKERHLAQLRSGHDASKRGGLRRLALVAIVSILCIIGLVVGLVIGLRNRNDDSNSSGGSSNSSSPAANAFPAGSYAVETYLSTVTTNCTSNPSTWRCYPYSTYDMSTTLSAATFSWIIVSTAAPGQPPSYSVSSTSNPFSLVFTSTPMTLMEANQPTEHFSFVLTSMNKPVVPSGAITASNIATICYFNQTTLQARLYTKMASTYPATSGETVPGSDASFIPWPYAAYVDQTASGGPDVPNCYDSTGKSVGTFTAETGGECSCNYQNYGT